LSRIQQICIAAVLGFPREKSGAIKTKTIRLRGEYRINAPSEKIYEILTDFERIPERFPEVAKEVRYLKRDGNRFVVEAESKAFMGSGTFKVRMGGN